VIIGVSPDPVKKLAKFKQKEELPFILLSDEEHTVAEKFGVWIEKKMYGRTYWGNERSSFLIGADGKIEKILRKVKPAQHNQQVLELLTT
jgi:peroxiredoxin Q/BCP